MFRVPYRACAQAECHSSDSVCMLRGRAKAARAARQAGASAKRRKMMADLETRERVWKGERSEEEAARAKLKAGFCSSRMQRTPICHSRRFTAGLSACVCANLALSNLPQSQLQACHRPFCSIPASSCVSADTKPLQMA